MVLDVVFPTAGLRQLAHVDLGEDGEGGADGDEEVIGDDEVIVDDVDYLDITMFTFPCLTSAFLTVIFLP